MRAQVRNLLQKRLARIIPVETIPTLTFAMLRQMADEEAGGATAATPAAEESAPAPEQRTDGTRKSTNVTLKAACSHDTCGI